MKGIRFSVCASLLIFGIGMASIVLAAKGGGRGQVTPSANLLTKYDPSIGQNFSLPDHDLTGRKVLLTQPTLLMHLGECLECQVRAFDPNSLKVPNGVNVVFVLWTEKGRIPENLRRLPSNWFIIDDPGGRRQDALNPFFVPRAYLLNSNRQIAWISLKPDALPRGVTYASD